MKILSDVFPAHLAVLPAGALEDVTALQSSPATKDAYYLATTRVIVDDTHVTVAQDSPDGALIVFREQYDEFIRDKDTKKDSWIVTKSGKMLAFKKDSNCGCGSRLRGWNAYKTIGSIKD